MPRFAANLSMMFQDIGFLDRFDAAARAGFRGVEFLFPYDHPPEAIDELKRELGDKIVVETSDWNVGSSFTPNHRKKPFDDARVRRALTLAIDRWQGAEALSKVAVVKTVGTFVFPGIETGREQGGAAEDRRLLARHREVAGRGAAAVEGGRGRGDQLRTAEPRCRSAVQIYRELADRQWSKIGLKVTQRVVPSGPWYEALRSGNYDVAVEAPGHGIVNPLLDVQKELPASVSAESYGGYEDPKAVEIYDRMLRETDPRKAEGADAGNSRSTISTPRRTRVFWSGGTASCRIMPMSRAGRSGRATSRTRIWRRSGSTDDVTRSRRGGRSEPAVLSARGSAR